MNESEYYARAFNDSDLNALADMASFTLMSRPFFLSQLNGLQAEETLCRCDRKTNNALKGLPKMNRILSYVVTAALALAALTAGPGARAEEKDSQGLRHEVQALKGQVEALQATVATLQGQLTAIRSSNVLALDPFVSVDPNPQLGVAGPNITFRGANLQSSAAQGRPMIIPTMVPPPRG